MNELEQQIAALKNRIAELEAVLKPFAQASYGFDNGESYLEYQETDDQYYKLFCDDEALRPLMVQDLIEAARVLPSEVRND